MNEKEILNQLNKFQNVKPDDAWKKSNRDILLSQISNSQSTNVEFSWLQNFRMQMQALTNLSQPAMAVVLIMLFIVSGGTFGLRASKDTKPGDSLYIAKIISEKAQLAVAFDQEKKMKLGMQFVGNRADELSQVLANKTSEEMTEAEKQEVNELVNNLKQEIKNVARQAEKNQTVAIIEEPVEDEGMVYTAGSGRTENGVQVSENPQAVASSSTPVVETNPSTILQQARELLNQADYNAAISKLEEAGNAVNAESGEVKGAEASSTGEVK